MPNLTFVPIVNVQSVNSFSYKTNWSVFQGNASTFYLQLQDLYQPVGFTQATGLYIVEPQTPIFLRYLPPSSSTLSLTFNNLDSSAVVTAVCSQPYSTDTSIWSFNLSQSQSALLSGGNVFANFVDGNTSVTFNFIVSNAMTVYPANKSSC